MSTEQSMESLLLEEISQDKVIETLPPVSNTEVNIQQQQSLTNGRLQITFTFDCDYQFSNTEFGRFYGYKTTIMFDGNAILDNENHLFDLILSLRGIRYQLTLNSDLSNSDRYIDEYKPFQDTLFSTLAAAIHESLEKGPPEFCQFDVINVVKIESSADEATIYHIMYQFDHDGFSMYDKTVDFVGTIVLDTDGSLVSSSLETVRVGIGL